MLKYYHRKIKDKKLIKTKNFTKGSWIYVEDPSKEEIEKLVEKHGLDRGHIKDALDPHEVPRLELEGEMMYIYTRLPKLRAETQFTTPLLIVINHDFLATISLREIPIFDKFIKEKTLFSTTQKVKFFIQIFFQINSFFSNTINELSKDIYEVSTRLSRISNKEIVKLVAYEQALNDYSNALVRTGTILNSLLSGKMLKLYEEDRDMIEDLFLANEQLVMLTKNSLQTAKNTRDAYSTIMTNNLNRVIKFFTSLTIIMTIPTIVASFYGMNVRLPFASGEWTFALIAISTLILMAVLIWWFSKNDWL